MGKLITISIGLTFVLAFVSLNVYAYPSRISNSQDQQLSSQFSAKVDLDEQQKEQQVDAIDLLDEYILTHPKLLLQILQQQQQSQQILQQQQFDQQNENVDENGSIAVSKRRVSVFNNIYHQCRIQKRKEKNLCMYLANLYQNLKGFHGL